MRLDFKTDIRNRCIASQLRRPYGLLARLAGNKMNETNSFLHDFTVETLKLQDNEEILEIGFGNGKFFEKMLSKAENLKVVGIELSSKMLKIAKRINSTSVRLGKLDLQLGNSNKMPFPDNSFDKVFCTNVIYFWDEPCRDLKEIYRVLRPGGKFYASFRSKKFMGLLPFSKYGFVVYEENEWIDRIQENQFNFIRLSRTIEPSITINGEKYRLESLCVVAQKPV